MNFTKTISKETIEKLVNLTDSLSDLNNLIEKLYVLSGDVYDNYINRINFKTERGKLNAENDFNIIKVMMEVINSYIVEASEISRNLPEMSDNILDVLRENATCQRKHFDK